jgi:hypothetical protein
VSRGAFCIIEKIVAHSLRYDNPMKTESTTMKKSEFAEHGNAAKPISFHPLKVDAVVAALLKVKPEPKPEK